MLHQTQPQEATQHHIHQTPDLRQRHMKRNLAIFHIDLRYVLNPRYVLQPLRNPSIFNSTQEHALQTLTAQTHFQNVVFSV